jgi:hypothetical protein
MVVIEQTHHCLVVARHCQRRKRIKVSEREGHHDDKMNFQQTDDPRGLCAANLDQPSEVSMGVNHKGLFSTSSSFLPSRDLPRRGYKLFTDAINAFEQALASSDNAGTTTLHAHCHLF